MAERTVLVTFQVDYDPKRTTGKKVAQFLDRLVTAALGDGEVWDDDLVSSTEGSPGVGPMTYQEQ